MATPKVFVSFASRDASFSRRLLARLRAQPVEVWDYSREGEEIPVGVPLVDCLQERIDRAEVLLAVVSPNAFASTYTCREVDHALRRRTRGPLRLIPIRLRRCAWPFTTSIPPPDPLASPWPAPYDQLSGIRFLEATVAFFDDAEREVALRGLASLQKTEALRLLAGDERESMEQLLGGVCRVLEVPYVPLYVGDPRLPLLQRFEAELTALESEGREFHHRERARSVYARLGDTRAELGAALDGGDYERAGRIIDYFIALCEYEITDRRLYYPYIVKSVCLLASGQLPQALEVLVTLQTHPLRDESLFSALGVIRHQQGRYAEALAWFQRADQTASERNIIDPAAKHGVLYNGLLSGARIDIDALLQQIDQAGIPVASDRLKVRALKALAYARTGRTKEALAVYEEMLRAQLYDGDVIMGYADLLCGTSLPEDRTAEALQVLEQHATEFGHIGPYRHRLAMLNWQCGLMDRALMHCRKLMADHPGNRRYWAQAAQVFWDAGDAAESRRLAHAMLDTSRFGLPASPDDFYHDGLANWILGRSERARYDFERSGRGSDFEYERILPMGGG